MSASHGYGCIVDAGSSGSRIYLYRWPQGEEGEGDALARVEYPAIHNQECSPGISDAEQGAPAFAELLSAARAALPPDVDPGEVPLHLGATAGMRLSPDVDAIMSRVRSMMHASGFLFRDEWARIITGDEESVYGWLVANYLKNDGAFPGEGATYGALDLGGASTQISLMTTEAGELYPLRVGSMQYPVYTHSYLGFGADQARLRYHDRFVSESKVSPCYATGFVDPDSGISGSSNWAECFESVAALFDTQHRKLRGGGGEEQDLYIAAPPVGEDSQQQRYIAMSVFVVIWEFLGLPSGAETADLKELKQKGRHICNMSYEQQTAQYDLTMQNHPPSRKTSKSFAQCFNAAYSYHLLSKGYGFPESNTPVEVYYDINGGKVQWALGMMLVEANRLRWTDKLGLMYNAMGDAAHSHSWSMAMFLFALGVILTLKSWRKLWLRYGKGYTAKEQNEWTEPEVQWQLDYGRRVPRFLSDTERGMRRVIVSLPSDCET